MNRTTSLIARFSPSFEMPKMASGVMKGSSLLGKVPHTAGIRLVDVQPAGFHISEEDPAERVADAEENEDHRGHDERHEADHREEAGAAVVHRLEPGGARL